MNLKKIQEYIRRYTIYLKSRESKDLLYLWEIQCNFQQKWDIDTSNFKKMYDESLQSRHTKRLWKRENYRPKEVMLRFIDTQSDFVREMFKDLYNEQKSIDGRVDRFIFHCDQLLIEYKEQHPATVENNHYHDYEMVSVYLAFRYPDRYALYDFALFKTLLEKLESRNIPENEDTERFFKIMNTLSKFLKKEEGLVALHKSRLNPNRHFQGDSLLLVNDFADFVCR